jgi:hypothetical protein
MAGSRLGSSTGRWPAAREQGLVIHSFLVSITALVLILDYRCEDEKYLAGSEANLVPLDTVRWSNFDRRNPKMGVFL